MKRMLVALALAVGGCNSSDHWEQQFESPLHTDEVINAVSAMPECRHVIGGGIIKWRAGFFNCQNPAGKIILSQGCSAPSADPPWVEVVSDHSAWDTSLAHELCHVCGYLDEGEADACAYRARAAAENKDGG